MWQGVLIAAWIIVLVSDFMQDKQVSWDAPLTLTAIAFLLGLMLFTYPRQILELGSRIDRKIRSLSES